MCFMNQKERSSFVRAQMTSALIEMLKEKSLEDISVRDLTDKAGVGRVSFYRNFENKEDILRQESDQLIREWGAAFEQEPAAAFENMFLNLFNFLRKYQDFYQVLYKAGLSRILMETIVSTIRPEDERSNAGAYIKSFWAYGIFGWVNEWINRGMPESGDEMDAMLKAMQPGVSNP